MAECIFAWIRWANLPDALRLGWFPRERGETTHHNAYSTLCEWRCACGRAVTMPGRRK